MNNSTFSSYKNEFTSEELNFFRKFILNRRKSTLGEVNKYERIEKARFYLEQEAQDLDQMILAFNAAKDEVDEFMKKKIDFKTIKPSGVTKFLQGLIRDAKTQSLNTNTILENGFIIYLIILQRKLFH